LHGFEHGVHAGLSASSRVAMQDWSVAHLVEKSTQTAELGRGFTDIFSTE
jgi:hypothetical protein